MVFGGKEGTLVIFVFFDQMCTTLLRCISNHAFLVCFSIGLNAYKCAIIINFLLTLLARYAQTSPYGLDLYKNDLGPILFCTDLEFV
jgi:hypothetical protein